MIPAPRVRVGYGSTYYGRSPQHEPHSEIYGLTVALLSTGGRAIETIDVDDRLSIPGQHGTADDWLGFVDVATRVARHWCLTPVRPASPATGIAWSGDLTARGRVIFDAAPSYDLNVVLEPAADGCTRVRLAVESRRALAEGGYRTIREATVPADQADGVLASWYVRRDGRALPIQRRGHRAQLPVDARVYAAATTIPVDLTLFSNSGAAA